MCIALITTAHPEYPFILINNRDEFLNRPTAPADWWQPPNAHVLGGRDLQRAVQGTWLGITKQGRIAVLTNFKESATSGVNSRGAIVNSYLTTSPSSPESPSQWVKRLVEEVGVSDVGGFSLAFGQLRPPRDDKHSGLAIVSNRTPNVDGVLWIADRPGQTHGLSNSHFGDLSWPKVVHGEQLLKQLVHSHVVRDSSKEDLIDRLFDLLSIDTLPRQKQGEDWETYIGQLRNSIMVPLVGGESVESQSADEVAAAKSAEPASTGNGGVYATQKQTVILVDTAGHVTFIEKTLYDRDCKPSKDPKDTRKYEFEIEGWNS